MQKRTLSPIILQARCSFIFFATGYHITFRNEDPLVLRPYLSIGLPIMFYMKFSSIHPKTLLALLLTLSVLYHLFLTFFNKILQKM